MVPVKATQQRRDKTRHGCLPARGLIVILVAVFPYFVLAPRASALDGGSRNGPAQHSTARTQNESEVAARARASAIGCNPPGDASCPMPQAQPESRSEFEQSSRNAPKITYANGQLTIKAMNSTLGDVLSALSTETGAVIEFPQAGVEEHVFVDLGPGPLRAILASLLNGSQFNYVLVESAEDPAVLRRMILTVAGHPQIGPSPPSLPQTPAPMLQAPPHASQNGWPAVVPTDHQSNIENSESRKKQVPGEVLEQMYQQRIQLRRQGQHSEAGAEGPP